MIYRHHGWDGTRHKVNHLDPRKRSVLWLQEEFYAPGEHAYPTRKRTITNCRARRRQRTERERRRLGNAAYVAAWLKGADESAVGLAIRLMFMLLLLFRLSKFIAVHSRVQPRLKGCRRGRSVAYSAAYRGIAGIAETDHGRCLRGSCD
jgi:hypothetical protein